MAARVAIVIVNYNSLELVCRCLASIQVHVTPQPLCIVVDNSDKDETALLEKRHPGAIFLRSGENLGFANGCNQGMSYAIQHGAEFVQLLNPDTSVQSDFLQPLVAAMDNDASLGMVSPQILYQPASEKSWYAGGKMNWWLGGPRHCYSEDDKSGQQVVPVDVVSGCAILVRCQAIKDVGFMDERYFLYYEDSDYVQQFKLKGWGVAYVPVSKVFHVVSSIIGVHSWQYVYYYSRNRILFMRKWASWYHFFVYMLFNTFVKLPGAVIIFGLKKRKPDLVKAYFKGYWDGLK